MRIRGPQDDYLLLNVNTLIGFDWVRTSQPTPIFPKDKSLSSHMDGWMVGWLKYLVHLDTSLYDLSGL